MDRKAVIERAAAAGIERLLVPGYDLPSSRAAVALAAEYPDFVQAAVGVHPHYAAGASGADWEELASLAALRGVVAIGEIGLDYFRNLSPPDAQRDAFGRQLELAAAAGKPVIVHDREAHDDIASTLRTWAGRQPLAVPGILHAFSGDADMAAGLAALGFLVSFALPLTFRSASGPRAAAARLPASQILVETDAPWLAPGGSTERNEPTTVLRVAAELARLRDTTPEAIASSVRVAYERFVAPHEKPQ